MSKVSKDKVSVSGAIIHGNGLNVEEAKRSVQVEYGSKDQYGKRKTVTFKEEEGVTSFDVTE